jgi:hypothetical protein
MSGTKEGATTYIPSKENKIAIFPQNICIWGLGYNYGMKCFILLQKKSNFYDYLTTKF